LRAENPGAPTIHRYVVRKVLAATGRLNAAERLTLLSLVMQEVDGFDVGGLLAVAWSQTCIAMGPDPAAVL
jgi:hypothetical protein